MRVARQSMRFEKPCLDDTKLGMVANAFCYELETNDATRMRCS